MSSIRIFAVFALSLLGCAESHTALVAGQESLFIAAAPDGVLAISTDGIAWDGVSTGVDDPMTDVAFGGGRAVALSSAGDVFVSANGRAWRRTALEPDGGEVAEPEWSHVAYSGGRFLALGTSWDDGIHAFVSADGVEWRRIEAPRVRAAAVTPVGGSFYITAWHLGDLPTTYAYVLSGDVFEETEGPAVTSGVRVGERSYAAGAAVYSTSDGRAWETHGGPMTFPRAMAHGDGTFVTVSERNQIHSSRDLETWTRAMTPLDGFTWYPDVAFGAGRFVAVGDEVIHSAGGITWERAAYADVLSAIVYAEFVLEVPTPPTRDTCPPDHPGETCGDTYCEYCENGELYRCATVEIEGNDLPPC